jgi:hypothetical protein
MDKVADLGCIVCRLHYGVHSPATIHHCGGKTKPNAHFRVLPLCGAHHQVACPVGSWATRHGPGRNAGKVQFEAAYGTEKKLMVKVSQLIDDAHDTY